MTQIAIILEPNCKLLEHSWALVICGGTWGTDLQFFETFYMPNSCNKENNVNKFLQ